MTAINSNWRGRKIVSADGMWSDAKCPSTFSKVSLAIGYLKLLVSNTRHAPHKTLSHIKYDLTKLVC